MYGNLDDKIMANPDTTCKMIDDYKRHLPHSKRYGSVFRNEMKELQEKHRIGEKASLAQWIDKWAKRAGPGLGLLA